MSRHTRFIALAIFALLLGIPLGYLVLAWHPAAPLTFHLERGEPTVRNVKLLGSYRARWVRVENSSFTPIEFRGATLLLKSGPMTSWDAPPGLILLVHGALITPIPRTFPPPLVVPARGRIVADAMLAPPLVEELPKDNVCVLYQWQSLPRSKASSMAKWLQDHGPAWAGKYIPRFEPWEEYTPLEGALPPEGN
ncbi:hypothetical protein [Roseimicrobium sp. ORNL1]|uniref:hypothetical protein n=1 Tax=Roseimicrobium sp. ORNL1 TaxID=2711231 RepID=UPI0013E1A598|nr:hypothetical protein [Roseimicrobium sp. ORNL1]QIF01947.1 hypothetical protein G5S37_10540 [Roseimicrobium sp. ORNL1]